MSFYGFLHELEEFTVQEYLPALTRSDTLRPERRRPVKVTLGRCSGTSLECVENNNLALFSGPWRKELLRGEGSPVGRPRPEESGVRFDSCVVPGSPGPSSGRGSVQRTQGEGDIPPASP